jgi:hypothetical protein
VSYQPNPVFTAFAQNGTPLAGGKLNTYIAGTTTPQATFTDNTLLIQNTNPVILNASGQAIVALNPLLAYKFVLTDAAGNLQWSVDNIQNAANLNFTFTGGATDIGSVQFTRTAAFSGGGLGFVNSTLRVTDNVTGTGVTSDEWAFTSVLNNFALAGQNVAGYFQGNKNGNIGPTWGAVIEVREVTPVNNPTNGTVALEVDLDCNGTDNVGNGSRVGVDLAIRQNPATLPSATFAQANWGYRIQNGGVVGNSVGFGFALDGGMIANVCFDTSHGTCTTAAYQMAQGQSFVFDGPNTQLNLLSYQGFGIDYIVSGVLQTRLMKTGGFQVQGNQVVGARIGGYGTPTALSKVSSLPGTGSTLAQVGGTLAALIADLQTHGLIGT